MPFPNMLELDSYVISRPEKFTLNVAYECFDGNGAKLFDIKSKLLGGEYYLTDADGKVAGSMRYKLIALTPSYELRDGSHNLIGKAIKKMQLGISFEHSYFLEDPNGAKIALAGGRDYLNFDYNITDAEGSKSIAQTRRSVGNDKGAFKELLSYARGIYTIEISDENFPRLLLLEFVLSIDIMSHTPAPQNRRPLGSALGPTGPSTLGGGSVFRL